MFVQIFTVFALFWLVLKELGMHSGLHACIDICGVCLLLACPGRTWTDHPIVRIRFLSRFTALFCSRAAKNAYLGASWVPPELPGCLLGAGCLLGVSWVLLGAFWVAAGSLYQNRCFWLEKLPPELQACGGGCFGAGASLPPGPPGGLGAGVGDTQVPAD